MLEAVRAAFAKEKYEMTADSAGRVRGEGGGEGAGKRLDRWSKRLITGQNVRLLVKPAEAPVK